LTQASQGVLQLLSPLHTDLMQGFLVLCCAARLVSSLRHPQASAAPVPSPRLAAAADAPSRRDRIAVFSAQFGGRDRIVYRTPGDMGDEDMGDEDVGFTRWAEASGRAGEQLPDSVHMFLYTDMINVSKTNTSAWQFVYPAKQSENLCDDNILCQWKANNNLTRSQNKTKLILASKFFKIRWIAESTQYDYIVWMDGKYLMTNQNLSETIKEYMGKTDDMLVMRHKERNNVSEELGPASDRAAGILHDSSVIQKAQEIYEGYLHEGFSDNIGLFDSAMFVVRPARVRDMFIDWWHEVQRGVPRDQIALPWMIQKHGINFVTMAPDPCAVLGQGCKNPLSHANR